MIDPKELRLKNLVLIDDKIREIDVMSGISATASDISAIIGYFHIHPIPLTEEWFKNFGFSYGKAGEGENFVEYWDKETPDHKHSFQVFTFTIAKWLNGEFVFSHHRIRSECKYVHQLQNLYFALTGQELELPQIKFENSTEIKFIPQKEEEKLKGLNLDFYLPDNA